MRWIFLIGLGLWMVWQNADDLFLPAVLIAAALGNLAATILFAGKTNPLLLRVACLLADLLFAQLVFASHSTRLETAIFGLLPLTTTALYFNPLIVTVIAVSNALIQGWLYLNQGTAVQGAFFMLAVLSANLGIGFPLNYAVRNSRLFGPGFRLTFGRQTEAARREHDRRRTIYDLISALNASLNYQRVLETSLDLSAETLDELNIPQVEKLVSGVLLFNDTDQQTPELQIVTARNILPADRSLQFPGTSGLLGEAIDEGEATLSRSVQTDPELSRMASLKSCRSAYGLPLRTGLDTYGLLLFAHPDPDFFSIERREVLDIVAKQAVLAIQNARLYRDLELEKNRISEIQEEGRKKLARDLHDGPTQSISAIAMRVNFARRLLERDPKAAAEELYKIEELARRTTKEIRHMLFTLRPLVLESHGLVAALESMAEKMHETFGQNVIIQADQRVIDTLEVNKQAVIFYIAEEAVNNARKHAKAEHVWVRLKMLRDGLCLLEVEDDGVGFDVQAVDHTYETRGSLGMVNLRERTDLVNGVLRIDSGKGRGTHVQVVIPLTEEAADLIHRVA